MTTESARARVAMGITPYHAFLGWRWHLLFAVVLAALSCGAIIAAFAKDAAFGLGFVAAAVFAICDARKHSASRTLSKSCARKPRCMSTGAVITLTWSVATALIGRRWCSVRRQIS